jgi:hypothetical protein
VFEYRDDGVEQNIIDGAKEDGFTIPIAFDAVAGTLESCMQILKECKGEGIIGRLASAIPLSDDLPMVDGVEVKFVAAPTDKKERDEFMHFVWNVWMREKLDTGEFVPSPHIKVVDGGLEAANKALDELKGGVSGTKLVIEI